MLNILKYQMNKFSECKEFILDLDSLPMGKGVDIRESRICKIIILANLILVNTEEIDKAVSIMCKMLHGYSSSTKEMQIDFEFNDILNYMNITKLEDISMYYTEEQCETLDYLLQVLKIASEISILTEEVDDSID